jgi:hypothetical protein
MFSSTRDPGVKKLGMFLTLILTAYGLKKGEVSPANGFFKPKVPRKISQQTFFCFKCFHKTPFSMSF